MCTLGSLTEARLCSSEFASHIYLAGKTRSNDQDPDALLAVAVVDTQLQASVSIAGNLQDSVSIIETNVQDAVSTADKPQETVSTADKPQETVSTADTRLHDAVSTADNLQDNSSLVDTKLQDTVFIADSLGPRALSSAHPQDVSASFESGLLVQADEDASCETTRPEHTTAAVSRVAAALPVSDSSHAACESAVAAEVSSPSGPFAHFPTINSLDVVVTARPAFEDSAGPACFSVVASDGQRKNFRLADHFCATMSLPEYRAERSRFVRY